MPDELEAIRTRHVPCHEGHANRWCLQDPGQWWPCDTAQVLARLDAAEARVAALEGLRPWVQAIGCIDLSTGRRIVKADVAARFEVGQ